jgi:tetratricopeptide (TPR) repeat protein
MKKAILFSAMTLLCVSIFAQEAFKALAVRGQIVVQRANDTENFQPVKAGTKFNMNDKIILNEKSYLGLTSTSGKTIELKAEGVYNVSDLNGNIKADNSSIAQKYVAYVFNEMRASDDNHAKNMSITGSVERSLEKVDINLLLPTATRIVSAPTQISWNANPMVKEYSVQIVNMFDEIAYEQSSSTTSAIVDFSKINFDPDQVYRLVVVNKAKPKQVSVKVVLNRPDVDEANELLTALNELKADFDEFSAIQNMIMGSFLEKNGLYAFAIPYYQKAIELEPEVEAYQEAYNDFMVKMGLVASK